MPCILFNGKWTPPLFTPSNSWYNTHLGDWCLLPAAIELRFMPDPPTLSTEAVHHMNKSDDLELTCRYSLELVSGPSQTHTRIVFTLNFFLPPASEVGSTWGGRLLRWAPASPPPTAAAQASSAQHCASQTPQSMRRGSTSVPTRTWQWKTARRRWPPMCS